jgi:hypothetical protein
MMQRFLQKEKSDEKEEGYLASIESMKATRS